MKGRRKVLAEWTKKLVSLPLDGGWRASSTQKMTPWQMWFRAMPPILYGQDYFYEELLGLRFRIALSFFQTNSLVRRCCTIRHEGFVGDTKRQGGIRPIQRYRTIAQILAPVAKKW